MASVSALILSFLTPLPPMAAGILGLTLGGISLMAGDRVISPELGRELAAAFLGITAFILLHIVGLFFAPPDSPVTLGVSLFHGAVLGALDLGYRYLAPRDKE